MISKQPLLSRPRRGPMAGVHLLIALLEHFGLIVSVTFLLLSWNTFLKPVLKETSLIDKCILTSLCGPFGMMDAIVNSNETRHITGDVALRSIDRRLLGSSLMMEKQAIKTWKRR